jgi:hypothetical protein
MWRSVLYEHGFDIGHRVIDSEGDGKKVIVEILLFKSY